MTIADQHLRKEIARFIQDGLAQQLTGILLAAKGLTRTLEERKALEATEAERLVHLLKAANKEIHVLLNRLK